MKKVIIVMMLMSVCWVFVACKDNNQIVGNNDSDNQKQEQQNFEKEENEINKEYDIDREFPKIIADTRLSTIDNGENYEEVSKISFSDLKGVTFGHVEEITADSITEVWLVKMSNLNQYNEIVERINKSIDELKELYRDNQLITAILENKENIIIEQKEGIVMGVIAPDASAIVSGIRESFNRDTEIPVVDVAEISGDSVQEVSGEIAE